MKVPAFLNATYSDDLKLNAFVSHSLAQIEAHIEANKPIFFPEYTDHSVKHIELVLQTAIDFASPAARCPEAKTRGRETGLERADCGRASPSPPAERGPMPLMPARHA